MLSLVYQTHSLVMFVTFEVNYAIILTQNQMYRDRQEHRLDAADVCHVCLVSLLTASEQNDKNKLAAAR